MRASINYKLALFCLLILSLTHFSYAAVENCQIFQDDRCYVCSLKYGLSFDSQSCIFNELFVPNCQDYNEKKQCVQCYCEYGLSLDRKTCISNQIKDGTKGGIAECRQYANAEGNQCLECQTQGVIDFAINVDSTACIDNRQNVEGCQQYDDKTQCLVCKPGRQMNLDGICIQVTEQTQILNCSVYIDAATCSQCAAGFKIREDNKQCFVNVDEACVYASADNICATCKSGFAPGSKGTCYTPISNCVVPQSNTGCSVCVDGYAPNSAQTCISNPIGCAIPLLSQTPPNICEKCATSHGLLPGFGRCIDNSILTIYCAVYQSDVKTCSSCHQGFYLNRLQKCSSNPEPVGCMPGQSLDSTRCTRCSSGYILTGYNLCIQTSGAITNHANCRIALDATRCLICNTGFQLKMPLVSEVLDSTTYSCQAIASGQDGCATYTSGSVCSSCFPGYLHNDTTQQCAGGLPNCLEYEIQGTSCTLCQNGFTLIFDQSGCVADPTTSQFCQVAVDGDNTKCLTCLDGYVPNAAKTNCIKSSGYGCIKAETDGVCTECTITEKDVGLNLLTNACVSSVDTKQPFCQKYPANKDPLKSDTLCETCYPGFGNAGVCSLPINMCRPQTINSSGECADCGYRTSVKDDGKQCFLNPVGDDYCCMASAEFICSQCCAEFEAGLAQNGIDSENIICVNNNSYVKGCLKYEQDGKFVPASFNNCSTCQTGYKLETGICTIYVQNCIQFQTDNVCQQCQPGYAPNITGSTCYQSPPLCRYTQADYKCAVCEIPYVITSVTADNKNSCVLLIDKCLIPKSETGCSQCISSEYDAQYHPTLQCVQIILNCDKYDDAGLCLRCQPSGGNQNTPTGLKTKCVPEISFCAFHSEQGQCVTCQDTYGLVTGGSQCSRFVVYCETYSSPEVCQTCKLGYRLNNGSCVTIITSCAEFKFNDVTKAIDCVKCIPGKTANSAKTACYDTIAFCVDSIPLGGQPLCIKCEQNYSVSVDQTECLKISNCVQAQRMPDNTIICQKCEFGYAITSDLKCVGNDNAELGQIPYCQEYATRLSDPYHSCRTCIDGFLFSSYQDFCLSSKSYCSLQNCFYYSPISSLDNLKCATTNDDMQVGEGKHDDNYVKFQNDLQNVTTKVGTQMLIGLMPILIFFLHYLF